MKKIVIFSTLVLLLAAGPLLTAKEGKRTNVFAGVGIAASDLEGVVAEIGIEKQFFGNFYGQFLFDYYFDPYEVHDGSKTFAYGFNFYGVYKFPVSQRINFILKAGLHLTILKDEWIFLKISKTADIGIAGGGGIEYQLSPKADIYGGVTVKRSLDEGRTWFKFYSGVSFRVK